MLKNFTQKRWKMIGIVFIGIGVAGGIFFFPVNINSQYTCLYHRMFTAEHRSHRMGDHPPQNLSSSSDTSTTGLTPNRYSGSQDMENSELLHRYILPFGFIWWFSLSLVFIGGYLVRRNLQKRGKLSAF